MFLIPNIALQMSRTLIRNDKWWLKVIIMDPGILVRPQLVAEARLAEARGQRTHYEHYRDNH